MVKIVEVNKVAPPQGSPTELSFPLTFFDILWLKFPPVERLFFYKFSSLDSKQSFYDSILPKLKHSLSLTLKHFLPLAGNLIWSESTPKPSVKYMEGDAVLLTIAESDLDFNHLSGNHLREAATFQSLIPDLAVSEERAAVSTLQITLFPNCGFCIGVSTHHAVLDGRSSTSFVKSWAQVCKLASFPEELKPLFDRSLIKYPTELDEIYTNQQLNGGPCSRSLLPFKMELPPDIVRGTFDLTRSNIQQLRQYLVNKNNTFHISSFSLTCAYAWVCLVKAEELSEKKAFLIIGADCRSRFDPPIPSAYFGNCIRGVVAAAETKDLLGKEGFVVALSAISEAIKELENGVLDGVENSSSSISSSWNQGKLYSIGGSPRFEVYSSDFGWGRPVKVQMVSIDKTGAIGLADSRDGNSGIQLELASKKHHMETFTSLFAEGIKNQFP
ncbi:hypothetical protein UlMin_014582 [Ulmus minor]